MDNLYTVEYNGYTIKLWRETRTVWKCSASKNGSVIASCSGKDRAVLLDKMQDEVDMKLCALDTSVQVSNAGLHGWLSK